MTDLDFDDPCLIFALAREAQAFLREFRPQQRFPGAPCWARFCGPAWLGVLVLQTGVGAARIEKVLEWVLGRPRMGIVPYRPKLVLSAGFSGALHEDYRVGDVVLATEVVDGEGRSWPVSWPEDLPPGEWQPTLHRRRVLTSVELVCTPDAKRLLGEKHDAVAVDMESATIARICTQHAIPFGCVRVISDDMNTPLSPQLLTLLHDGRVSPFGLLAGVVRSPRMVGEIWRLARQTTYAAEQLGKALGELLTLTLPWGSEL